MPALNTRADALKLAFYETPPAVGLLVPMLAPLRTIPGVTILGASHRNGPGKGLLRSELDGRSISWRAPGSGTFGASVIAEADADYLLEDGEDRGKCLQVRVKTAYLRPAPIEQPVYLQDRWNLIFEDIPALLAGTGHVGGFVGVHLELRNVSPGTITNIRAWKDPASGSILVISGDGITYTDPTTEETGLELGSLGPGATRDFYVSYYGIPPNTPSDPRIFAGLHFRFDGV